MITSLGGTGGFVSPAFVGWVKTQTGSAQYGLIGLAVVLLAGVVLLLVVFPVPVFPQPQASDRCVACDH